MNKKQVVTQSNLASDLAGVTPTGAQQQTMNKTTVLINRARNNKATEVPAGSLQDLLANRNNKPNNGRLVSRNQRPLEGSLTNPEIKDSAGSFLGSSRFATRPKITAGNSNQSQELAQSKEKQVQTLRQLNTNNSKKEGKIQISSKERDEMLRAFISPSNQGNNPTSDEGATLIKKSTANQNSKRSASSGKPHSREADVSKGGGKTTIDYENDLSTAPSKRAESSEAFAAARQTLKQAANSFRQKLLKQQADKEGGKKISQAQVIAIKKVTPHASTNSSKTLTKKVEKELGKVDEDLDSIVEYRGMKMTVGQRDEYQEMEEDQIARFKQSYYPAKFASKKNGVVVSYAANTHQGMVRNYNEDRVSIILNIIKPKFKVIDYWPRCSFFAIYDGHGGAACADFLRDQLHQLIVRDPDFPQDPKLAMQRGFAQAEKSFLEFAHSESVPGTGDVQRSGSCAIVILIVGEVAYVANVGDSRAFMSIDGGDKIIPLSIDHKPENEDETRRIEENGGKVYQNQSFIPDPSPDNPSGTQTLTGPHRVFPGRLSVSRTIGDIEAKDPRYNGNPNVVIAIPEIRCFKIKDNYDYIMLGCDGIFEKCDNQDIYKLLWNASVRDDTPEDPTSVHERCGASIDSILNGCIEQKTLDNVTAVIIGFKSYETVVDTVKKGGMAANLVRSSLLNVQEADFDWDAEECAIQDDNNPQLKNLMKPLEPVEEEGTDQSGLDTPCSEVIDITKKAKRTRHEIEDEEETSIMSSKRVSQTHEEGAETGAPFDEIVRKSVHMNQLQATDDLSLDNVQVVVPPSMQRQEGPASLDEEQGGGELRKSHAQIGNLIQPEAATVAVASKTSADFKIRKTSMSPRRARENSRERDKEDMKHQRVVASGPADGGLAFQTRSTKATTGQNSSMSATTYASIPINKQVKSEIELLPRPNRIKANSRDILKRPQTPKKDGTQNTILPQRSANKRVHTDTSREGRDGSNSSARVNAGKLRAQLLKKDDLVIDHNSSKFKQGWVGSNSTTAANGMKMPIHPSSVKSHGIQNIAMAMNHPQSTTSGSSGPRGRAQRLTDQMESGQDISDFQKQKLMQKQVNAHQKIEQKSGGSMRARKKSGNKLIPSTTNHMQKTLRLSSYNGDRPTRAETQQTPQNLTNGLPATYLHPSHISAMIGSSAPGRTSNSRNIGAHLPKANTQQVNNPMASSSLGGRVNAQHQPQITQTNNLHQKPVTLGSGENKAWYSNTVNLNGIKHLVGKQQSNANNNQRSREMQHPSQNQPYKAVIRRLREQ